MVIGTWEQRKCLVIDHYTHRNHGTLSGIDVSSCNVHILWKDNATLIDLINIWQRWHLNWGWLHFVFFSWGSDSNCGARISVARFSHDRIPLTRKVSWLWRYTPPLLGRNTTSTSLCAAWPFIIYHPEAIAIFSVVYFFSSLNFDIH